MTKENAVKFRNYIGSFQQQNQKPTSGAFHKFLRFQTIIDSRNPLRVGVFIRRENFSNLWISFKYERVSDLCFECGRLRHSASARDFSLPYSESEKGRAYEPWGCIKLQEVDLQSLRLIGTRDERKETDRNQISTPLSVALRRFSRILACPEKLLKVNCTHLKALYHTK